MGSDRDFERMPPVPEDRQTPEQKTATAEVVAGPRGQVNGPFNVLLRSPKLFDRTQKLGEYLRYHSVLPARLREFAILLVAAEWKQNFEWYVHHPLALKAGLAAETAEAVRTGRMPERLEPDEAIVYAVHAELSAQKRVSDATYEKAFANFGETGIVDLVATLGYYQLLATVMNTAQTAIPDDGTPAFVPPWQAG